MNDLARIGGGNDVPIDTNDKDLLGFEVYVEALGDFILSCDTPMTVAIQGDWGSGKTSLMNLIRARLSADDMPKKVSCVWINTWQFSQFDLGSELPFSVISLFSRELAGEQSAMAVLRSVRDLAVRATKGAALMATAFYTGKDSAEALVKAASGADQVDATQRISEMRESLKALVSKARQSRGVDRFVVFVDDIDRLVPARAVELLEVMKVFLDLDSCVFVLACDYQVVSRGLRAKFGADSSDLKGKHFFDKIIQLPFSMPVGQQEISDYVRARLAECGIELSEDDGRELSYYQELLAQSVGFNPRGLKRLSNCLRILRLVADRKGVLESVEGMGGKSERERALFAALCLQTAYEALYIALIEIGAWRDVDFRRVIEVLSNASIDESSGQKAPLVGRLEARLEQAVQQCEAERPGARQSIPLFVQALKSALQIKGGNDEELEPHEVAMFISMLRFASITATSVAVTERTVRIDLSHVKEPIKRIHKHFCSVWPNKTYSYFESDGSWFGPVIAGLGFTPYLGIDGEGGLTLQVDVNTRQKSKVAEVRENAKIWCVEFLQKHFAKDRIQVKKGNALYGVVLVEIEPAGFSARPIDEVEKRFQRECEKILIPMTKFLQDKMKR